MIPVYTVQSRMKRARECAQLDQEAMARRLGVHAKTIARWEQEAQPIADTRVPKLQTVYAYSVELDVPVNWLLYGMTEAPAPTPIGASAGASGGGLPRLDSNQQPAGYRSVASLDEKRERVAARQRVARPGRKAA